MSVGFAYILCIFILLSLLENRGLSLVSSDLIIIIQFTLVTSSRVYDVCVGLAYCTVIRDNELRMTITILRS